jgi:DNA polymerase-4/protein ImuB
VHYDEVFTQFLLALESVSPVIEPTALGRAFVGVDGLEGLYGGPEGQLEAVVDALKPLSSIFFNSATASGCDWTAVARFGWAYGKFTAWVAATRAKPGTSLVISNTERMTFLRNQPVAVLPVSTDTHRRLSQLGLESLADVARLPEAALVSQFGAEGRHAWHLATGSTLDPVIGRERPEPIAMALDFPDPVTDQAMLSHALNKLVDRALGHPQRVGWRIQTVRVRAELERSVSWLTEITLKNPSADRARIVAPLNVRLEQNPPSGAVEHLAVEFLAFAPGTDELQLFARDAASSARAGQRHALHTAAREIKTRFKRSLLHHVVEVQPWSRIPERRYALIDFEP